MKADATVLPERAEARAGSAGPSAAKRPRLLLHIGTHKTGTTSIQKVLEQERTALGRAGVHYARTDRGPWPELPKHTSVFQAAAAEDPRQAEAERALLLAEFEASGAHTLVLSEEGLSEPAPRLVDFFAPWSGRFDIRVVCLLRRQDLFVESLYNQFTREPARREGRSPLAFARAPAIRQRLDYAALLAPWRERLGAQVTALDFDTASRGAGLLAAFAQAGGLDGTPLARQPLAQANRSPDMRLCLALRRLNLAGTPYQLGPLLWAAARMEREGRFPPLRQVLGRDERCRLLDQLAASNERLAQVHGVRFAEELPPGEAAPAVEDVDVAYLLELLAWASRHPQAPAAS